MNSPSIETKSSKVVYEIEIFNEIENLLSRADELNTWGYTLCSALDESICDCLYIYEIKSGRYTNKIK